MLKNIKRKDSGFTLVELLIVIVIIAILAVLTLVGVNGYINRANDSKAKDSAGQLRTKIEAYNTVEGSYPADTDALNGTDAPTEANLNDSITSQIADSESAIDAKKPLFYEPCDTATDGGTIHYWQKAGDETITVGSCS